MSAAQARANPPVARKRRRGRARFPTAVRAEMPTRKVAWLGTGIMGSPMAANLAAAGFSLSVWNRSSSNLALPHGASAVHSVADALSGADMVFAMVSDPSAAQQLALDEGGVATHIRPNQMYVDCSTIDPSTVRTIEHAITARGAKYMEAPVAGSKGPAEQGALIFMCGGDRSVFNEVQPLLDVMGKKSVFMGEAGSAAKAKAINNMLMSSMLEAYSEALSLTESSGISMEDMRDVIDNGAMACPMYKLKGASMQAGEYQTAFPLKHAQKDMRIALGLADEYEQACPVAAAANQQYIAARRSGHAEKDFSAVHTQSAPEERRG